MSKKAVGPSRPTPARGSTEFAEVRDAPFLGRRRVWWSLLLAATLLGQAPSVSAEGFGPFPVRNFQPFHQLVLGMPGDRAAVVKQGTLDVRVELAETSSIFRDETAQASAIVKFETLRSGVYWRYGLTDRLELAAEIPVLYRSSGFLEGLITATERATTGLAPAREALRDSGFAFQVSHGGRTLFAGSEGAVGLGDITLFSKYHMLNETATVPALSVRLAVKVPTGDTSRVFGSGHTDVGLGLAAEKRLASRWLAYANLNAIFPTGRIAGLPLQPVVTGLVALEYMWSSDFSLTAQFDYYSPPFHGTGTRVLDKGVTESAVGFSYRILPALLWQVYGVENLDFITGSAADFTLSTVFTYRFQ